MRKAKNILEINGTELISINDSITGAPSAIKLRDLKDYLFGKKNKKSDNEDTPLNKMKIEDLVKKAKELKINNPESFKKGELIEAIDSAQKHKQ